MAKSHENNVLKLFKGEEAEANERIHTEQPVEDGEQTNEEEKNIDLENSSQTAKNSEKMTHYETKLANIRTWCTTVAVIYFVTDVLILYKDAPNKQLFPNKIAIIAEAIVMYPMYFIFWFSYKRKNYDAAYILIILLILRTLLGFLNPPREEVGRNLDGRLALKWMVQLTLANYSINLAC